MSTEKKRKSKKDQKKPKKKRRNVQPAASDSDSEPEFDWAKASPAVSSSEAEVSNYDPDSDPNDEDDLDEDAGDFVDEEDVGKLKPGRPKKGRGKGKGGSKRPPIGGDVPKDKRESVKTGKGATKGKVGRPLGSKKVAVATASTGGDSIREIAGGTQADSRKACKWQILSPIKLGGSRLQKGKGGGPSRPASEKQRWSMKGSEYDESIECEDAQEVVELNRAMKDVFSQVGAEWAFNESGFLKHIPDEKAIDLIKEIVHADRVWWGKKAADTRLGSIPAKAHFGTTDSEHQDTVKMLGLKEPHFHDKKLSKYISQLTNKMPALQYLLYFVPISFWQKVAAATNKYFKKWVDEGCGVGEGLDAEDEWDEQLRDTFAEAAEGDKKKVKVYGLEWVDVTVQDLLVFIGLCSQEHV